MQKTTWAMSPADVIEAAELIVVEYDATDSARWARITSLHRDWEQGR